jgi:exodeoxyribonuclease-5
MNVLELNKEQQGAVDAVLSWAERGEPQTFTLAGLAGTGKTTIVGHLMSTHPELFAPVVVAPTGKAAQVLVAKGVDATTIHSFCYKFSKHERDGSPVFDFRGVAQGSIVVCDEASMVDAKILKDLLSTGVRFLFVGDHGQLPPVGEDPGLMRTADVTLETICRQAEGNPIVKFAHALRRGEHPGDHLGGGIVQHAEEYDDRADTPETAILVGSNAERCRLNETMRRNGTTERIVVLRNERRWRLFNGQVFEATDVVRDKNGHPQEARLGDRSYPFWPDAWLQPKPDSMQYFIEHKNHGPVMADYGYALTVHKAQGSEWDRVVVFEDCTPGGDSARWRYTAATRAKKDLVYLVA